MCEAAQTVSSPTGITTSTPCRRDQGQMLLLGTFSGYTVGPGSVIAYSDFPCEVGRAAITQEGKVIPPRRGQEAGLMDGHISRDARTCLRNQPAPPRIPRASP